MNPAIIPAYAGYRYCKDCRRWVRPDTWRWHFCAPDPGEIKLVDEGLGFGWLIAALAIPTVVFVALFVWVLW